MINIGLTGNRYSGKDRVSRLFKQIHIPVFDADLILRFAINYNTFILQDVKRKWSSDYFIDGNLNMYKIKKDNKFGELLTFFEDDIFLAYDNFNKKNKKSIYTIFHSSILFESGWDKKMIKNITVFAPTNQRIERCKFSKDNNYNMFDIHRLSKTEMDDLDKNNISDYVIHNYGVSGRVLDHVCDVDRKLVDYYLHVFSEEIKNFK